MVKLYKFQHIYIYIYIYIYIPFGIHTFIIGKRAITTTAIELLKIIIYLTSNFSVLQTSFKKYNKFSTYIIYYNKLSN